MSLFLVCALAYVLGSIPNGLVLCRLIWHIDIREYGSHNIGATNVWRTLGKGPGFLVFFLDFLKGLLGVWFGLVISGEPLALVLGGVFAIVGHSASLFLGLKGGKGVATGLGVIAMLMPPPTLLVFLVWLAIVYLTKYVSLGSIVGAALVPVLSFVFHLPTEYTVFGVFAAVLIIYRHKANIGRLLNGTESKIKAGHRS